MSILANLEVRDVTAHFRGNNPDRQVQVGVDGTRLILAVDMKSRGNELARIIARGDKSIDDTTWLQALVDVIAALEVAGVHAGTGGGS